MIWKRKEFALFVGMVAAVLITASCSTYRIDFGSMTAEEKIEFQRQYHARQNNVYIDNGYSYWDRPGWRGFYRNQWGWNLNWWYNPWNYNNYFNQWNYVQPRRIYPTRNVNTVRNRSGNTRTTSRTRTQGTVRRNPPSRPSRPSGGTRTTSRVRKN